MMSISGSAIVYRNELEAAFSRKPVKLPVSGRVISGEELRQRARRIFPRYRVMRVIQPSNADEPFTVVFARGTRTRARLINPYTGEDLGDPYPAAVRAIEWLVDLHENLLFDARGRFVNGIAGACVTLVVLTGAVIWWPGIKNWRRALSIDWGAHIARVNWDLHSALGFWCFLFVLMWAISGFYFAIPGPINALAGLVDPRDKYADKTLLKLSLLHFGRFGWLSQIVWVVLGLVPAVLTVTGLFLCCHRMIYGAKHHGPNANAKQSRLPCSGRVRNRRPL